jgi:putative pyruvate formate lyase activating enzyme
VARRSLKDEMKAVEGLREMIRGCRLCPRRCGVDRAAAEVGACRIGREAVVASSGPHFGEEPVLVGRGGSGTIFFAGCNLDCVFCQNSDLSHSDEGQRVAPAALAAMALGLERRGCENINVVTPTHVSHAVAEAIVLGREQGLAVPVVYNCGGYESVETLRLLEGLVEIYMPDFKWADADAGRQYSGVPDYPAVAEAALAEMYRQVGPLELDDRGVAARGVLVRHLVMPGNLARSHKVIDAVARAAPGSTINVMAQYRPCYRAAKFPELLARVRPADVAELQDYAASCGLVGVS